MHGNKHITQIVALPRSRTAWLSVALHGRGVHGFHDQVGSGMDAETYRAAIGEVAEPCVVDCSSALIGWQNLIDAVDSNIILIDRKPEDSLASYKRHVGEALAEKTWPVILDNFTKLKERFADRIVGTFKFEDLGEIDAIAELFAAVSPWPHRFDAEHVRRLQQLNIQEVAPSWAGHLV